jgi:hypothetical protein
MKLRTSVLPSGRFGYGIHKPDFVADNFREKDDVTELGQTEDGQGVENQRNFPPGEVEEPHGTWIYEIPNAFPFRGATFISKNWADENAADPARIALPCPPKVSMTGTIDTWLNDNGIVASTGEDLFGILPEPIMIAIATSSTDSRDLVRLAKISCEFVYGTTNEYPSGLLYGKSSGGAAPVPRIHNHPLFEAVANNPHLPEPFKQAMVLRPGVQGGSEIVGEWAPDAKQSHVFEYLRRNSYIPWGHYAANMANDTQRYSIAALTLSDMQGMRHLYYQRTYARLARLLDIPIPPERKSLSVDDLEQLRGRIQDAMSQPNKARLPFNSTLWGWNFGFDYAPSKYRLHASHQQIHQQYALLSAKTSMQDPTGDSNDLIRSFACGDMIAETIEAFRRETGKSFFQCYIQAIRGNHRMDGNPDADSSLIIFENEHVMVFVPKAQTSHWEIQVMPLKPMGNVLETDTVTRASLDGAFLVTLGILEKMGARMVTGIEYSKRFDAPESDQHLLYCFLPKLPISPGGFSEAQQRWIVGHYPEDFAKACRSRLTAIE